MQAAGTASVRLTAKPEGCCAHPKFKQDSSKIVRAPQFGLCSREGLYFRAYQRFLKDLAEVRTVVMGKLYIFTFIRNSKERILKHNRGK